MPDYESQRAPSPHPAYCISFLTWVAVAPSVRWSTIFATMIGNVSSLLLVLCNEGGVHLGDLPRDIERYSLEKKDSR